MLPRRATFYNCLRNVFFRYAPEKIEYAINRYQNETARLYRVLDRRLSDREFLAGGYSIADIATFPWVHIHDWAGVSVEDMPNLKRWMDTMAERPACQRGLKVPPQDSPSEDMKRWIEKFRAG